MKKILVTGASGFIGSYCLERLVDAGYEVHAVSSKPHASENQIFWHQVDLFDYVQIENLFQQTSFEYLLHFAWIGEHGIFWHSPLNLQWVSATLELAAQFAKQGGTRCVVAGTCAEYAWNAEVCDEKKTPLLPATLYGVAKNSLRAVLESFFLREKISFCWGRIFYPYGPLEKTDRLIPMVIRSVINNKPVKCTHGNQLRDFLYVEDVADLFVSLIGSPIQGALNVGSGQATPIKNVCLKIALNLNAAHLLQLGALSAPIHDTDLLVANVDRLTNELKWTPKYSLDEGLEKTIAWWKEQTNEVENEIYN